MRQNDENIIQWRIQVSHQKKCMISSSWQNDSTAADITSFHHTISHWDPFFSVFGIGGSCLLRKHFYIVMMHKTRQRHVHSFWLNYPIAHSGRKRPKQPWVYRSQMWLIKTSGSTFGGAAELYMYMIHWRVWLVCTWN